MNSLFRRYIWAIQIGLLLISLLLILVSNIEWLVKPGGAWSNSFLSIGVTLLTTVVVTIIYSVSRTDAASILEQKLNFQSHVFEMGLEAIHLGIKDDSFFDRFPKARSIDMMYNTAKNCSLNYGNKIEDAIIRNGCKVRILIADSNNKALQENSIINALCPGTNIINELRDVVAHLQVIKEKLERQVPLLKTGSLEVRQYFCVPTNSIVIVDDYIVRHTPYLPYFHSSEVPVFDIVKERGGKLFNAYQKVFEEIWDHHSTSILKIDFKEIPRQKAQNPLDLIERFFGKN